MTGYVDDPKLSREDAVRQAALYMSLYMTAYSALIRLAGPDFPSDAVTKTAQHARDDIDTQIADFKAKWPHYDSV